MRMNALRALMALMSAAMAVQASAWEIVTEHVRTKWYEFRADQMNSILHNEDPQHRIWRPTCIDIEYDQNHAWKKYGHMVVVAPCVENTGAHYKQWKFVCDKTPQEIADIANAGDYTVVDFEEYTEDGVRRYAALMERFPTFKEYFLYAQTNSTELNDYLDSISGGKIVDMDVDDYGNPTLHGAINFGVPTYGVTWSTQTTWDGMVDYLSTSGKRLLDLQRREDGRYCALYCDLKPGEGGKWNYFGNHTWSWVHDREDEGWRVETVNSAYDSEGQRRLTGVLVWNG